MDTMAEHLWALLEHAAGKGDFTKVDRTFLLNPKYCIGLR